MVAPFLASVTVTSLAVPVSEPSGSPLARASAVGTGAPATSASVIGCGAGAGAAAGATAGADGVCAEPDGTKESASSASRNGRNLFVVILILSSPLFPNSVLEIMFVQYTDNSEETHYQTQQDEHQPATDRAG